MSNAITNFYHKITAVFHKLGGNIQQELTPFEHAFLQAIHPLMNQIQAAGEMQLLALGHEILVTVLPDVLASGGNMGKAISAAAPKLLDELQGDLTQDAKNAAYGVLAIAAAQIQQNMPAPADAAAPQTAEKVSVSASSAASEQPTEPVAADAPTADEPPAKKAAKKGQA